MTHVRRILVGSVVLLLAAAVLSVCVANPLVFVGVTVFGLVYLVGTVVVWLSQPVTE